MSVDRTTSEADNLDKVEQGIVLLVDDNPTNLGVLFESLSTSGFKLLVAEDGESALDQINYVMPDIILLDVMMPGIDGFETCRRLQANPATQDIPVIFMTALTDPIDKITGLSIGAVDYITKPIQPDEVLARVKTHLTVHNLKRQLQRQNMQLHAEIQDRNRAEQSLHLLLSTVSHDLRNPVTGMLMVLKNLLNQSDTDHKSGESDDQAIAPAVIPVPKAILERMVESGDRQLKLINSLLDTHSSTTQKLILKREPVQLSQLVSSIVQDIKPLIEKNQSSLKNLVSSDLPFIDADPNQLWRVFENLVANALKHNPPGLHITIDAHVEADVIRCVVRDNGVGISPEEGDRLFEPYSRGDNAHRTQGLGLGLYLCRQIVAAHHGQIGVDSQPDKGSTFWFTLPLAKQPQPESQ